MDLSSTVVSSAEAARVLGIHPLSIQKLIHSGALAAEKNSQPVAHIQGRTDGVRQDVQLE